MDLEHLKVAGSLIYLVAPFVVRILRDKKKTKQDAFHLYNLLLIEIVFLLLIKHNYNNKKSYNTKCTIKSVCTLHTSITVYDLLMTLDILDVRR